MTSPLREKLLKLAVIDRPKYDLPRLYRKLEECTIPEPNSGCVLWVGAIQKGGYGSLKTSTYDTVKAHRAAWLVYRGEIPDGMSVLHKCDVRCCVNPNHLYIGTQIDNMRDLRIRKRRAHIRGEKAPRARINGDIASAIYNTPGKQRDVAAKFGVTQRCVWEILHKVKWWPEVEARGGR